MSAQFRDDRALFRQRLQLGLDTLKAQPNVDATKTAAIGYCFGGTGALELARSGADVNGVVSFHGGLSTPNPDDAMNIRAKVLVCHGADDPLVPHDEVVAFMEEMSNGEVDCQFIAYTGAVHSFTDKGADGSRTAAAKYHEPSDRRSWQAMRTFFDEVFGRMPRY